MSKWYTTVGYPGGEFAAKGKSTTEILGHLIEQVDYAIIGKYVKAGGDKFDPLFPREHPNCYVRPAPPELAEWLDGWKTLATNNYMKEPGGWLWCNGAAAVFIPVAGAAGITVLEEGGVSKEPADVHSTDPAAGNE